MNTKKLPFLKLIFSVLVLALFIGALNDIYAFYIPIRQMGTLLPRTVLTSLLTSLVFLFFSLALVWKPPLIAPLNPFRCRLKGLAWVLSCMAGLFTSWFFLYTKYSAVFSGFYIRLLLLAFTLMVMAWLVTKGKTVPLTWDALLRAGILIGSIFILADVMQEVIPYPFSLSWSEGNRLWDYSVLYGRSRYNYPIESPLKVFIDPGRQSLWGIPFIFPNISIQAVRFWNAFLFTIPYALLGWFVFRPVKGRLNIWLFGGLWAMLFLGQGPIYTPLVLAAILVAGSRRMPLALSVFFVALAGYYAGITRSTWVFAPAMWAGLIAFLEENPYGVKTTLQRWLRAAVLAAAGLFGSLGVSALLGVFNGLAGVAKPNTQLVTGGGLAASVGRQPLLWDRLWPNATYAPGIVLGLILAAGPLILILILFGLKKKRWPLNIWQQLAIWGSSLAFLVVGLIVSVKIGGGSNLHNLDMFLIQLLFLTGLAWEAGLGDWLFHAQTRTWWNGLLLLLVIFIPTVQGVLAASPRNFPSFEDAAGALEEIRTLVHESGKRGEVLFLDQRQLLTFGYVENVPLIPEYEKKLMMDQAMAANSQYFEPFYRDLAEHRFVSIISEPLRINFQGGKYDFGSENDAFVYWVSMPVLCYYQPVVTFQDYGVEVLMPRSDVLSESDPNVKCPIFVR